MLTRDVDYAEAGEMLAHACALVWRKAVAAWHRLPYRGRHRLRAGALSSFERGGDEIAEQEWRLAMFELDLARELVAA